METFVVRVWVPGTGEPPERDPALRGILDDIGSRRQAQFESAEQLIALVSAALRARRRATDDRPEFRERKGKK